MKVNQSQKVNPQSSNNMEIFLKSGVENSGQVHKEDKVNQLQIEKIEKAKPNDKYEEIEEMIRKATRELEKIIKEKEIEFSKFNEIIYNRKLQFKLLMVTTKIYTLVRDPNSGKSAIIAIAPPRWGGSSLRYLISTCSDDWCQVVIKETTKGRILTYKATSLAYASSEDDIFD